MTIPAGLLAAIRDRVGLTAAEHVLLGIRRAMARAAATDPREYERLLDTDPAAFSALITELTVGETYFLREPGQFDFIRREVLPALQKRTGHDRLLRAWSAGCASGEEAYSLAIVGHQAAGSPMRVLGTDIAESRLIIARKAEYGEWSLRGVPAETVAQYFRRIDRRARVIPEIRSMVEFRALNLAAADWTPAGIRPGSMDLVLCRNVLIYLDPATTALVAQRLIDSLTPDGWLFLGASDPALAELIDCEVVVTGAGIAYRRGGAVRYAKPVAFEFRVAEPPPLAIAPPAPTPMIEQRDSPLAPRKPSEDAALLLDQARQAYEAGNYSRASEAARDLVAIDSGNPEGWIVLVRSLANIGRHEEAGLACAAGLDVNRTSAELTYMHAVLLRQAGKNAEALNALRCAVYLDRQFVVAHLAMGDVLSALGDREGARRALRNAERLLGPASDSQVIPGADGLDAGRLRALTAMRIRLMDRAEAR